AESNRDFPLVDNHRYAPLSPTVGEHAREVRGVLLDVHVLERHVTLLAIVERRLRVRTCVLAEDDDHSPSYRHGELTLHLIGERHGPLAIVVEPYLHGARARHHVARRQPHDVALVREARSADRREAELHLELVAVPRLCPKVDLRAREDHALSALPARRDRPRDEANLLAPQREPRLLQIREIHGVVDVAERVAVAEANGQPMRDQPRHARTWRFASSRRSSCRRSSSTAVWSANFIDAAIALWPARSAIRR